MGRRRRSGCGDDSTRARCKPNGSLEVTAGAQGDLAAALLTGMREGAFLAGPEGDVRAFNPAAEVITGRGAGEVLLTSWDRDGTRSGYDLALLSAVCQAVRVPVIASGGAADAAHLAEALQAGADAVLAASIFHDDEHGVDQVKRALLAKGVEVRP